MQPRILIVCCTLLAGIGSLGSCQLQTQQNGRKDYSSEDLSDSEDLITAASRSKGKRSGTKKHSDSDSDSDSYHVVYESKPQQYSNEYHHQDTHRDAPRSRTYSSNSRGGGGRNSYNPYSSGSTNNNRRHAKSNNRQNEDYDDYGDSPKQQQRRQSRSRPQPYDDYDYDNADDIRRDKGYDHKEEFDRSQKDDYHKSGKLKDDFDGFGQESQGSYRGGGGRGGGGGKGKNSYSNSDRESSDSDYDDEGFSTSLEEKWGRGGGDDRILDRYEQQTRKALREYGGDRDGRSFLNANRNKKK